MSGPYTIYLAGELFSAKHLTGNAALADHIGRASGGRYECVLPQDMPQPAADPHAIRDQDLLALLRCDAAIFNYDGLELDSGTVVEYMFAKFADIPAVLLRTDFRHAGDSRDGDPWNLMNSYFPRTENVWLNGMELYHQARREGAGDASAGLLRRVAGECVAALDRVMAAAAVLPAGLAAGVYEWLALMPGFANMGIAKTEIERIYREKVARRLV